MVLVRCDELLSPLAISVCRVEAVVGDGLRISGFARVEEVRRVKEGCVGKRSKKLVVAAGRRPAVCREAQVPFADRASCIAEVFEAVGDGFFSQRKTKRFSPGRPGLVELMAEPRLIAARVQPGPRRTAVWA